MGAGAVLCGLVLVAGSSSARIAPSIDCVQTQALGAQLMDAGFCQEVVHFCDHVPVALEGSPTAPNNGFFRTGRQPAINSACPPTVLAGDVVGDHCICPSGSGGIACTPFDVTGKCPGDALPTPAEDETAGSQAGLTGLNVTGTIEDPVVSFQLHIPMVAGRTFTSVSISAPGIPGGTAPGCTAAESFTNFTIDTPPDCQDTWNVTVPLDALDKCGFRPSATNPDKYEGTIYIGYTQPIEMAPGITGTRNSGIALQFSIIIPKDLGSDSTDNTTGAGEGNANNNGAASDAEITTGAIGVVEEFLSNLALESGGILANAGFDAFSSAVDLREGVCGSLLICGEFAPEVGLFGDCAANARRRDMVELYLDETEEASNFDLEYYR